MIVSHDMQTFLKLSKQKMSNRLYFAIASIVLAVVFSLLSNTSMQIELAEDVVVNQLSCSLDNEKSKIFEAIVFGESQASRLLSTFCGDVSFKQSYGGIKVSWSTYRQTLDVEKLSKGGFGLFVSSEMSTNKEGVTDQNNYMPIVKYGDSWAYLISKDKNIAVTSSYLKGKKIGLVNKAYSLLGQAIAIKYLVANRIDVSSLDIRYYPSHGHLRKALQSNEVDIISSYFDEKDDPSRLGVTHRIRLDPIVTGFSWYTKTELINTPVGCKIYDFLESERKNSRQDYFKNFTVLTQQTCQ
jgi:hypothetical protein